MCNCQVRELGRFMQLTLLLNCERNYVENNQNHNNNSQDHYLVFFEQFPIKFNKITK